MSAELLDMLTYKRRSDSTTELEFIDRFIAPFTEHRDDYGNYMRQIGEDPKIMWSAHTDTVHHEGGRQRVIVENGVVSLAKKKVGTCLGADNAGGVWILTEMIKAEVPGLYIFHRDEESGGLGSSHIARKHKKVVEGIDFAIAFDRRGYDSVITHQGGRTASDEFAQDFAQLLGGSFKPDPTGLFTDTANYSDLIPECTNISMGYHHGHGPKECLDLDFITKLRDKIVSTDFSGLKAYRDPAEKTDWWGDGRWDRYFPRDSADTRTGNLQRFVEDNPLLVADFLEMNGFDVQAIEDCFFR